MITHQFFNKSSIDMSEVESQSVDLIVSSPPYKKEDGYDPVIIDLVAKECFRVLKSNSLCFINFGQLANFKIRPFECAEIFSRYFDFIDTIIWVKNTPDLGGHYKPVNSKYRLNNMFEYVFQFSKGKAEVDRLALGVPFSDKSNIKRYGQADDSGKIDLRCAGNVWYVPYPTVHKSDQKPHKDHFPERLPEQCILLSGIKENSIVLDPFVGSGSVSRVAHKMNINSIGYEINKEVYDTIRYQ